MLGNYFKIAIRNLLRNTGFSVLNISGLAIGMASAVLILLWIQNELSYDRFHEKVSRLYQVWSNDKINGSIRSLTNTPEIMAPSLKKDYPEIEGVTRMQWTRNLFTQKDNNKILSTGAVVDPDFLTMFSFPLIDGDIKTALNDPHSLVVTQKFAKKMFNTDNVMGKTVTLGGKESFTISGILKELPNNTQFDYFEYLAPYSQRTGIDSDWTNISIPTYVLLRPNTTAEQATAKIKNIIPEHSNGAQKTEEFLYPVSELWLRSEFENGKAVGGRITMVNTFSAVAIFILLIACINFMNLSTARSEKRAKEVGIRKVSGALRNSLVAQFLGESVLIALVAGFLALVVVIIALPAFNTLVGKQLHIEYYNINFWIAGIGFILFTGVLAGSYPAFFLSSFKPIFVLKGGFKKINALVTPRKALVVLQFTFAIVLIICTIVVTKQLKYAQARSVGFEKDHMVHVFMNDEMNRKFELIKNDLLNSGTATYVSKVLSPITSNWSSGIQLNWQGKDPNAVIQINRYAEGGDLVKTAGLQLIAGRDIDIKTYPTDSSACLINESALNLMKFKDPIGQVIFDYPDNWHVVGVIKNYIQESPFQPVRPMVIKGPKEHMSVMIARLNSRNAMSQNIAGMEKVFKRYNPLYPPEFTFTDEEYNAKFSNEQQAAILARLFAGLTIFISCLGLFGLATYMAENRIKEIGVRKVLGASVTSITSLLSKDFLQLVLIAIVIGSPIAWWFMNGWLSAYDYRINIGWSTFLAAGSLALIIALFTISYQSIKAALANPVRSLRSE